MKKHKHKLTGNIAVMTKSGKNYRVSQPQNYTIPSWLIENSIEWEEVKETLSNNWYKYEQNPANWWLGYINEDFTYYGFNGGEWFDCEGIKLSDTSYWRYTLATKKEISTYLINEAKKRYKVGDKVKSVLSNNDYVLREIDFVYLEDENSLNADGVRLFHNGKWASIIKEENIEFSYYAKSSSIIEKRHFITPSQLDRINQILNEK